MNGTVTAVDLIESKESEKTKSASYSELFGEADALDWVLMFVGSICALGTGASLPVSCVLFGRVLDKLNYGANIQEAVNFVAILFVILACGTIAVSIVQVIAWTIAGERQSQKIRTKYVRAMLSQEIGW
jgi:ATP-binding cassette, subfamily B (MDR/TAP), member 1